MGRLPDTFAQRKITFRQPWAFFGDKLITAAQQNIPYPDATFQNSTDKPFEIHRMIPRVVAQDADGIALAAQPAQELMQSIVRIMINDLGKSTPLLKSPTPLDSLVKGSSERTWEWAEPYYLVKGEQLQVTINASAFPTAAPWDADVVSVGVRLCFEGFFLVLAPPSENR